MALIGQSDKSLSGAEMFEEIAKDVIETEKDTAQDAETKHGAENIHLRGRHSFAGNARRHTVKNGGEHRAKAQNHDKKQNIRAADASGKHGSLLGDRKGASPGAAASKNNQ